MSGRLGELLVRENLISVQQLRKAQEEQQKSGARIGTALIKTGAIEESKLTDFLSKQYGVPAINLKDFDIDPEIRNPLRPFFEEELDLQARQMRSQTTVRA